MEVSSEIKNGDEILIKELVGVTLSDVVRRTAWSQTPATWEALIERLRIPGLPGDRKLLLQLANNISACPETGKIEQSSVFLRQLADLEFLDPAEIRLQWQIMANISTSLGPSYAELVIDILLRHSLDDSKVTLMLSERTMAVPYLIVIKNATDLGSQSELRKLVVQRRLFYEVMDKLMIWHDDEEGSLAVLAARIYSSCATKGLIPIILENVKEETNLKVTLFEALELLSTSDLDDFSYLRDPAFWAHKVGSDIAKMLLSEVKIHIPPLVECIIAHNREGDEPLDLWNFVRVLLDVIASILPLLSEKESKEWRESLLHESITLLKSTKELPMKSKLGDPGRDHLPYNSDFPYLRSSLIPVITALVRSDKASQDEMRLSGALNVILESCVIDSNNPYMKERAILCIRYLLEGNQENQDFVAAMEARNVVDEATLEKSGYETQIVNGKIQLKKA